MRRLILRALFRISDDYFAYIEQRIGLVKKDETAKPTPKAVARSSASVPVASGRSVSGSGGEVMTLSPLMRETAWELYPDKTPAEAERQYALDRAYMIKSGRMAS